MTGYEILNPIIFTITSGQSNEIWSPLLPLPKKWGNFLDLLTPQGDFNYKSSNVDKLSSE